MQSGQVMVGAVVPDADVSKLKFCDGDCSLRNIPLVELGLEKSKILPRFELIFSLVWRRVRLLYELKAKLELHLENLSVGSNIQNWLGLTSSHGGLERICWWAI